MNCQNLERWIVLSLEDGLNSRQKNHLEKHLKECAGCRESLEDYRAVRRVLAALPPEPVPVLPAVRHLLSEKRKSPVWLLRRIVLVPAALVILLLLSAGITRFRFFPSLNLDRSSPGTDFLSGISEREFLDASFLNSVDNRYLIDNLSAEEQKTFLSILQDT